VKKTNYEASHYAYMHLKVQVIWSLWNLRFSGRWKFASADVQCLSLFVTLARVFGTSFIFATPRD